MKREAAKKLITKWEWLARDNGPFRDYPDARIAYRRCADELRALSKEE